MLQATYPIELPVFEGPLDLLLQLIERDELDITVISLAQVTDQYLQVIEEMGERDLADLTAFLVVAAKLVLIKSRVLLPGYRASSEDADDVANDLVGQLETYRRFKEIAQELAWREEQGLQSYIRIDPSHTAPVWYDLDGVLLGTLLTAAQEALDAIPAPPVEEVITPIRVTIAEQTQRIRTVLARRPRVSFHEVLSERAGRVEVIITLLAVLELLKQNEVRVVQERLFGPILIEPNEPGPAATAQTSPA